jgi:hypothetical protein
VWPLAVASEFGRYLLTFAKVIDGHVATCPFFDILDPSVLHRSETACLQVCNSVLYGFLFIHFLCIMFRSNLQWNTIFKGGAPQA